MPTVSRHPARYRAYRMFVNKRPTAPGTPFMHIIRICNIAPNNEYTLHATKGYRYRRLPKSWNALLDGLMQRIAE